MSGFDDRRNDPTVLGQPGVPYPSGDSPAPQDAGAEQQGRPWKRDSGFHQTWQPPAGWAERQAEAGPGADPTLQWQPNPAAPDPQAGAEARPNYQWQPGPSAPAPTVQWQQPGGPAQPAGWQTPAQADPTLLAQPVSGGSGPGAPGGLWQPSLGADPNQSRPAEAAPTLLGYPQANRLGQPDPGRQWQPAPGQYGEVPPIEQYQAPAYGTPQYGQPAGYGPQNGFGGPPQGPSGYGPGTKPPGGRGKAGLLIGLVVLLVAAGAVTAIVLTRPGSDNSATQQNSPSMVSALTPSASAGPTSSTTTSAAPTTNPNGRNETPVIPGYQVVVAPDRGAAYDVPAGWTVAAETVIGGFGEPPNAVAGKGYASEGKGYCPGSTRTVSFLTGSQNPDSATAATDLGTRTAKLAYTGSADGTPSAPVPLASLDGTQHGMFVETKGTVSQAKPGCATAYSVYTVAYPTDSGNFVMVIAADTGVPNALDADTAKRIFTSIRAHDG
ncbi:hypothetical protein F5X71_02015 [Nocardia brasiliensis]|uniref:DUF8017 domain-containing protein n=1 Tax=Nocardia brasiliensis TaxID=37326 RepID=A0A6G9XK28_NOCBR|nr:hypothetical protein [Nocardia brasiliensis]QIS01253.1 hypothetical protein F5X71_02015 [Nocardia brasiliensis]